MLLSSRFSRSIVAQSRKSVPAARSSVRWLSEEAKPEGEAKTEVDELAATKTKLSEAEAKVAELKEKYTRALADMENVRRIAQMDVDRAKKYACASFAKELLDVADNLSRATAAVPEELRAAPENPTPHQRALAVLYEGVVMTENIMLGAFKKQDITRFRPSKGDPFDPSKHMALFRMPSTEFAPNTVAQCIGDGYLLHDRVLRAASVGVHENPGDQQ